ncbi:LysR family transcriptional regulator [Aquibacillus rhizosphaerae]|uniref:LysR family transcriptional regulator n=1 Tax=Aquibacillus rhizosphaerae TaxID=3051431 RepID=A0ABT7L5H8_9BACI|nr:LysR family transcriptional regulator [Aquibacillus sp. LR5S19]MDL4841111.1 LysR family transcriptional regulator [Aquibacillus sp. LR5S19]
MYIRWLQTFLIATKHENFRKTSEELFLTQPAVTKHIKRLEETLNIELFERKGKTVSLTTAGYKFLPYASEIVEKYEQGMANFESWKQGYDQKLIISAAPQIASSFLPSLLRKFIDKNPSIEVIINVVKSYDIGEEVSSGRADLGLSRIRPLQTNIKTELVHKESVVLVGPKFHQEKTELDETTALHKYRLIIDNHPDYWDLLLNDIKRHYPAVRTMTVNQVEATKRFIEKGLGVSYLPLTMVKEEINGEKLVKLNSIKIDAPISCTYALTKVETNEVITFIKFLKEATNDL